MGQLFQEYYEAKTKHRKLQWFFSLGTVQVKGFFKAKTIEMSMSSYQAALLMHSLSCAKHKVLKKEPEGRTVGKQDVFHFNESFTDKMRRIKIPLPPMDEKKKVMEDVDKDRRYATDAAIVRIMKTRK